MKRLLKLACSLALVAVTWFSWAAEVSSEQAGRAVRNWIRADPRPMDVRFSAASGTAKAYSRKGKAIFHVVQLDGEGFVVTSGDTRQTPIVAFSASGHYEDDERNPLHAILQEDQARILDALEEHENSDAANPQAARGAGAFSEAEAEWASLLSDAGTPSDQAEADAASASSISDVRVNKLIQTKWGQSKWGSRSSSPNTFNKKTPNNYVCGCVATAGAQIMRFWQRPTEYIASFSNTCKINGSSTKKDSIAGSFAWGSMPLSYDSTPNISATQQDAIAMLTYNVGVAVGMNWTGYSSGSSADTGNLTPAFRSRFNYQSGTFIRYNLNVGGTSGLSDFKNALYASLDAGMPVSMSIGGDDGGHSIVADGYGYSSGTLYTHLNMGWSGSDDVWYNLVNERIACNEQGYIFTTVKGIGFNIHPSTSGDVISGRVLRSSGAAVSGASVKLYGSSGSLMATTTSNSKGIYSFRVSSSGSYTVKAESGTLAAQTAVTISSLSSGGYYSSGARTGNKWGVNLTLASGGSTPTLSAALDNTSLTFTTGGSASWYGQTSQTHDGTDAARSGALNHSQSSWMQTTVSGPGTISFWWYASCEGDSSNTGWDYLSVSVDGVEKARICGTDNSWVKKSYTLSSGSHTVKWTYQKDGSLSKGDDAGFVDQVTWTRSTSVTVYFNSNGGSSCSSRQYTVGGTYGSLPIPTKSGYTFAGWYSNSSLTTRVYPSSTVSSSVTTLYAKWTSSTVTLSSALDNASLTFTTGGDSSWFGQTSRTHDGTDAARSGTLNHSQSSWMQTTVSGPGTIAFWWNVDSESDYDKLELLVDGTVVDSISGTGGSWAQKTYSISSSGSHTIKWRYSKDGSVSSGLDAGFVDQVTWTPSTSAMTLRTALDNTSLTFTTGGSASWYGQTSRAHDGTDAARSGTLSDDQSSWMQTTVSGPGTISFWWYVSCEGSNTHTNWDYLAVFVDGDEKARICGTDRSWAKKSLTLPSGSHTVKWKYRKDGSVSSGLDAGFVDQVTWTRTSTYTVTFNANGGSGRMSAQKFTKDVAQNLTANAFRRTGYTFAGWATRAGGSAVYTDGQRVKMTSSRTLYATWREVIAGRPDTSYARAQTGVGALYRGDAFAGTMQVKFGKISRRNTVKVSATATILVDGRARKFTAKAVDVNRGATRAVLTFREPIGKMVFEMKEDGTFTLRNTAYFTAAATVGGVLGGGQRTFRLGNFDLAVPGRLLDDLLPYAETFDAAGGRWQFAKAASVKLVRNRATNASDLVIDNSASKTNLSGLKITYAARTGLFRGSFKAYALEDANGRKKLAKYTVSVIGFVVNGSGSGEASCRRPAGGPWTVTVK